MGLDSVEIIIALEERFGIQIPDRRAVETRTVRDLEELVLRLRTEQLSPSAVQSLSEVAVRAAIRHELAYQLNLDPDLVKPEADLTYDLGLDR